jgi:hypothetical protein
LSEAGEARRCSGDRFNKTVSLTDSKNIADAMALHDAIDILSAKVMECVGKSSRLRRIAFAWIQTGCAFSKDRHETALKISPGGVTATYSGR